MGLLLDQICNDHFNAKPDAIDQFEQINGHDRELNPGLLYANNSLLPLTHTNNLNKKLTSAEVYTCDVFLL